MSTLNGDRQTHDGYGCPDCENRKNNEACNHVEHIFEDNANNTSTRIVVNMVVMEFNVSYVVGMWFSPPLVGEKFAENQSSHQAGYGIGHNKG